MDVIAAPPLNGRSAPLTETGSLDIFQVLCLVVDNFDWNAILSPYHFIMVICIYFDVVHSCY